MRKFSVLAVALGILGGLCLAMSWAINDLPAQEDSGQPAKPKPEQIGLYSTEKPFQYKEWPYFRVRVPQKGKAGKLLERWRFVDLEERTNVLRKRIEDNIQAEQKQDRPDQERLDQLNGQLLKHNNEFSSRKFMMEVDGAPRENVRVEFEEVTRDRKLKDVSASEKTLNGWEDVQVITDKVTTTRALKKKGRQSHRLEVIGKPKNSSEKFYFRIETILVPPKDGGNADRIRYYHQKPEAKYNKKTAQEAQLLFQCFRLL